MAIRFDGPSSIGLPAHTPQTAEQIFERYKDIVDPAEVDLFLFEIREFQAESVEEDEQPGAERSSFCDQEEDCRGCSSSRYFCYVDPTGSNQGSVF